MKKEKSKLGGKRPGSGRKPVVEGEKSVHIALVVSASQKAKLARIGGAPWIRARIDAAREPKNTENG